MTRINCVDPKILCQQHLVAEYRELPRVFRLVEKAVSRGESPDSNLNPTKYTLGKGHVRFFYPRLMYLIHRQCLIIDEMLERNITVNFSKPKREDFLNISDKWFGEWTPTEEDLNLNQSRINIRMPKKPIWRAGMV